MVDRMIAAGDLGRKTGTGFYTYDDNRLFGS
jgi:3-hydroxybutyryl-CoA dehydrogenase